VKVRLTVALSLGVAAFGLAVSASASPPVGLGPPATAEGLAIQVIGADQTTLTATADAAAPPGATLPEAPFAYPDDGSIVSAHSTTVEVSASAGDGTASALTEVVGLSLFGGEITAESARGSSSSAGTIGDLSDSALTGLSFLSLPVPVVANARVSLGDWGYAVLLPQSTTKGTAKQPSWRGTVSALVVHLTADHGGLAAGSEIRIGYADAYARPPVAAAPTTTAAPKPAQTPTTTASRVQLPPPSLAAGIGVQSAKKPKKKTKTRDGLPVVLSPPTVTPKLTAGGYVFPVYGPSGYGDTFGAPRGDVSGGWHHGDDIFAPLGAPLLAVADGTVFSVGWNNVGGWRLWLRDRKGNEFYYAHLSAYTKLAHNGARVKAGQVLGFVGNTGDAQGTPFHLHFEVHPVAMLFLGYDGAVDPTKYLDAWKRLADVRILPAVPFAQPQAEISKNAPAPGAILLEASDISTANGLDPASLKRAMRGQPTFDVTGTGVGQLPTPLPNLDRA
jgi:murein DD-endopeptidase MepM/ murein hydrolase activator NlpD